MAKLIGKLEVNISPHLTCWPLPIKKESIQEWIVSRSGTEGVWFKVYYGRRCQILWRNQCI